LQSFANGAYSAWCLDNNESVVSVEAYDCEGVDANQAYDCINGGCLPKTTYGTPGFYANLAACQSGCAKNSNCKGECVTPEEIAALQQAANQLQNKICKR
jgi:selenophosphate synthase